jgi:hypothetical protein
MRTSTAEDGAVDERWLLVPSHVTFLKLRYWVLYSFIAFPSALSLQAYHHIIGVQVSYEPLYIGVSTLQALFLRHVSFHRIVHQLLSSHRFVGVAGRHQGFGKPYTHKKSPRSRDSSFHIFISLLSTFILHFIARAFVLRRYLSRLRVLGKGLDIWSFGFIIAFCGLHLCILSVLRLGDAWHRKIGLAWPCL